MSYLVFSLREFLSPSICYTSLSRAHRKVSSLSSIARPLLALNVSSLEEKFIKTMKNCSKENRLPSKDSTLCLFQHREDFLTCLAISSLILSIAAER